MSEQDPACPACGAEQIGTQDRPSEPLRIPLRHSPLVFRTPRGRDDPQRIPWIAVVTLAVTLVLGAIWILHPRRSSIPTSTDPGGNPPEMTHQISPTFRDASERIESKPAVVKSLALGGFEIDIPVSWTPLPAEESQRVRLEFAHQLASLDRAYDGESTAVRDLELQAFRSAAGGRFQAVWISVAPENELMAALEKDLPSRVRWGIDQGLLQRASQLERIERDGWEGYQMKLEFAGGALQSIAGLTHSGRSGNILQLQYLAAPGEDASELFNKVLRSIRLANRSDPASAPENASFSSILR